MSNFKSNAMRILDKNKVAYTMHSYVDTGAVSGQEVAAALNENPFQVFKTLVTVAKSGKYYVFMLPVSKELDLKKAASSVNEKSVEMLKLKNLFPLTGYVHGGCSPIGMKKQFPTVVDISAQNFETLIFSAGKIGYQVEVSTSVLSETFKFVFSDIVL